LLRKLAFATEVVMCDARDLLRLESENPFASETARPDLVQFVSILSKAGTVPSIPLILPVEGDWYLRVIAIRERLVCGVYRRHMKTIGYLGQLDKLFGTAVTTRSWSTILAIARILKSDRSSKVSFPT
jgi:hypothetical protein